MNCFTPNLINYCFVIVEVGVGDGNRFSICTYSEDGVKSGNQKCWLNPIQIYIKISRSIDPMQKRSEWCILWRWSYAVWQR